MRRILKGAVATSVMVGTLAGGFGFYANAADQQKPSAPGGMMQGGHGDMAGMMNMMQQMNQMMESCNSMMKQHTTGQHGTPKDPNKPAQKS